MNEIVKSKSEEQKNVIKNIKTLYASQEKITKEITKKVHNNIMNSIKL